MATMYQKINGQAVPINGSANNLSGLSDTNINNPQNEQILKYDSTTHKWVNGTGGGGGESGLIPVDPVDTSNINIWIQTS